MKEIKQENLYGDNIYGNKIINVNSGAIDIPTSINNLNFGRRVFEENGKIVFKPSYSEIEKKKKYRNIGITIITLMIVLSVFMIWQNIHTNTPKDNIVMISILSLINLMIGSMIDAAFISLYNLYKKSRCEINPKNGIIKFSNGNQNHVSNLEEWISWKSTAKGWSNTIFLSFKRDSHGCLVFLFLPTPAYHNREATLLTTVNNEHEHEKIKFFFKDLKWLEENK